MFDHMRQRRGTTQQWATANPVLGDGEIGIDKDTGVIKVGNGVTTWLDLPVALSSQYLPILGKAADSDKLDGNDSTYFMPASAASSFLPVAGKAADADKLDGNDSTYFLPASAASSFLPVAGKAEDSNKLNGQLASFYMPASSSSSFLPVAGKAADSGKLNGQAASFYMPASSSSSFATPASVAAARRELGSRTVFSSTSLTLADEACLVTFSVSSNSVFTIPPNATVAFPIGGWVDVQTTGPGTVTIHSTGGASLQPQVSGYEQVCVDPYAPVRLLKTATNDWQVIGGTTDTGVISAAATAPWSQFVSWRVKNGWMSFYYIGTSSVATPGASPIFTFPRGARPSMPTGFTSIYSDVAAEVNVIMATDASVPGQLSLNKPRPSGFGVAVSGSYPVAT